MLNHKALVQLEHELQGKMVLSVFIDGESRDPAQRQRWRLDLRHALDAIDARLAHSSHGDRVAFAASRERLMSSLYQVPGAIGAPGWAGFFTPDGEIDVRVLRSRTRTSAAWQLGPMLTPCLPELRMTAPVLIALVDARRGQLYRYGDGDLVLVQAVSSEPHVDDAAHMSQPPRVGFHAGTRGRAASDAAQREILNATHRMFDVLCEELTRRANADAWILVGGVPECARSIMKRFLPAQKRRGREVSLDVHATPSEIVAIANQGATVLRNEADYQHVASALTAAAQFGRGEVEPEAITSALQRGQVKVMYLTCAFIDRHSVDVEAWVHAALRHGCHVVQVEESAAELLDNNGGVVAQLRYAGNGATQGSSAA